MHQPDALHAKRLLIAQLVLTGVLPTVTLLALGPSVALSVLIGAASCLLATAVFAFWVFRGYQAQRPEMLLTRFYGAEVAKIAVALGIFAVAFVSAEGLNLPALLAAYLAVQLLPAMFVPSWGARAKSER
jgi:ATP synthase protein I